jgi:hypothetical protein
MHRFTYLANDLGLGNAGVQVIDIPIDEPITALWLEMRCANGANHNDYSPMHLCVQRIDLIDGANVMWGITGPELLGLVCGQLGFMPHQRFSALGGDPATLALPLMFGRFLGDTEYAFNPKAFTNPQFRVVWNLAAVNAIGANGYATGGLTMTLIAEIMNEGISPRAMLAAREVFTYTTVVGTQFIDLPRDHIYKALMIRPVATTSHWFDVITRFRLNLDGGKAVPIDMVGEDLQYMLAMRQPKLEYRESAHPTGSGTLQLWLKEVEDVSLNIEQNTSVTYAYENFEYGQQTIRFWVADAASLADYNTGIHCVGYCPFHCVYVPFGDGMKPEEWFQAPNYGSVRLELTGAIAARAMSVVALQEEPY